MTIKGYNDLSPKDDSPNNLHAFRPAITPRHRFLSTFSLTQSLILLFHKLTYELSEIDKSP